MELKTKKPIKFNEKKEVATPSEHGAQITEENVKALIAHAIEKEKTIILNDGKVEMDRQLQSAQASYISVFGIFASITSFLTIEFQFLKGLGNITHIMIHIGLVLVHQAGSSLHFICIF